MLPCGSRPGWAIAALAVTRVVFPAAGAAAQPACADSRWKALHAALDDAYHGTPYADVFSPEVLKLTEPSSFEWYKTNYQDCVEGLLSLVLYLSYHNPERRRALLDLADETARELSPLALRSGLSTWPFFGLLGGLNLIWQNGEHANPLATEPWRLAPCGQPVPAVISPLLAAIVAGGGDATPLGLARSLQPGMLLIDAGAFDGTDWTATAVAGGATVLAFEPLPDNHQLFEKRFPAALEQFQQRRPVIAADAGGSTSSRYTMLPVLPGQPEPQLPWNRAQSMAANARPGHAYVVGAALGERVRALNMTTRYDYSSIADQGYLNGPEDMRQEEVAMTTLDHILGSYVALGVPSSSQTVEVLKLDVEGYEMGVLRGAERLLAEGRVHYLVLEFHPGMLGSTGTDPSGLLDFLRHYCFLCHSLKINRPYGFREFVARYTTNEQMLPLQGLGALEDLICQNLAWRPPDVGQ